MEQYRNVYIARTCDTDKLKKGNYTTYTHWGDEGSTICDNCEADLKTTYVLVYAYTLHEALIIVEEMEKDRECVNKDTYKVEGTAVSFKYIDEDGDEQTFYFDRKINCVYLSNGILEDYSRFFYLNDIDKYDVEGERGYVDLFNYSLSEVLESEEKTIPGGSELEVAKALLDEAEKKVKEVKAVLEEAEKKATAAKAKFEEATKKSEAEEKIKTQIADFDAAQKLEREKFLATLS